MSFDEASPDETDSDEWIREDYLDDVKDRETSIDFVWALIRDHEDAAERAKADPEGGDYGAYGWQNSTIEAYFEAALACVAAGVDSSSRHDMLTEPSWTAFADFLYCGKIYE